MLFLFLIIGLTGSIVSALYLAIIKMLGKKNDNVLVIVICDNILYRTNWTLYCISEPIWNRRRNRRTIWDY